MKLKHVVVVKWHEVKVRVRHAKALNNKANALGVESFLDGFGQSFCHFEKMMIGFRVQIPEQINLFFRENQRVAVRERVDVEHRKNHFVPVDFMAGDFAVDDAGEN